MTTQPRPDQLSLETPPAERDIQALHDGLAAFNTSKSTIAEGQRMAIFSRDNTGMIVAGIYGWLWGECLEIVLIWVDEPLRNQGLGQQLLAQMEGAGRDRGARVAMLETFSFQAPEYYAKHGYETFGVIEGYGGQHAKHFMRKELSS